MEVDKEVLNEIVSEQAEIIKSKALEQIKHIQEDSENSLNRIVPEMMDMIKNFSVFKMLDVLDIIRNGGIVKTCEYKSSWNDARWHLMVGSDDPFYKEQPYRMLSEGRYRITLIMEKLAEEAEA